jgi:hypothetical protein
MKGKNIAIAIMIVGLLLIGVVMIQDFNYSDLSWQSNRSNYIALSSAFANFFLGIILFKKESK